MSVNAKQVRRYSFPQPQSLPCCFSEEKQKWKSELKRDYVNHFLGYYDTELDAAKAYNDYAVFVNERYNTNYELNDIRDYMTTPRDIPNLSKQLQLENKTSRYTGVSYDQKREYFCVCIKYKRKTYHLGHNKDQIECAKLYNQQALYLNNHYGTKYTLNEIPYPCKNRQCVVVAFHCLNTVENPSNTLVDICLAGTFLYFFILLCITILILIRFLLFLLKISQ